MTDKPIVQIQPIPSKDFIQTNSSFGYFYEDNLKKKTLRHIPSLKSIYDPGVFSRGGKYVHAIKAFIIKGQKMCDNFEAAVKNNDFFIFPKMKYQYNFSVDEDKYQYDIVNNLVYVYKNDYNDKKYVEVEYFHKQGQTMYFKYGKGKEKKCYYFSDFKIDGKICNQIYLLNPDIFMITFNINIEIDGLFHTMEEIKLEQFKAEQFMVCNNLMDNIIKKDKYVIYEIKSGKDISSLSQQIERDYYFFKKFFEVYSKYDIKDFIIFGFFRTSEKMESVEKAYVQDFQRIRGVPIPVVLFRYENYLFGEDVLHENVELSEIGELKLMVNDNSEKIEELSSEIQSLNVNVEKKYEELSEIINKKHNELKGELSEIKQTLNSLIERPYNAGSQQGIPRPPTNMYHPAYPYPYLMYPPPPFQWLPYYNYSKGEETKTQNEHK